MVNLVHRRRYWDNLGNSREYNSTGIAPYKKIHREKKEITRAAIFRQLSRILISAPLLRPVVKPVNKRTQYNSLTTHKCILTLHAFACIVQIQDTYIYIYIYILYRHAENLQNVTVRASSDSRFRCFVRHFA